MDYVKALIIKFVMCLAVLWIILGIFYNVAFGHIFTLSLILTAISFILGDLYLLPKFENWGATISDFFLAFAIIWVYSVSFINENFSVITAAALSALVISVGEIFFHRYVDNHIFHNRLHEVNHNDQLRSKNRDLQTEFGDEIKPPPKNKK
ncbi:YndM family protein [Pseudogracilibacillus sp. SE30717A]|uniref:YndM family protein n=1 Tax=Pseudogracilibacillus sp. SE30717A TaxID=3098293 RepID=UPI00300E68D2